MRRTLATLVAILIILTFIGGLIWMVKSWMGSTSSTVVVSPDGAVGNGGGTSPAGEPAPSANEADSATVDSDFVTCAVARGGMLYVGTEDNGLWRVDAATGRGVRLADDGGALPNDAVTALAVDTSGRLWVGWCYHGVSVFNGKAWKNYDAPTGPLGHHIFHIAVSPLDGDVWLATELGLARYSQSGDVWTHLTRADGVPSDQMNCLRFAADGTLYAATQCDGLAIASAADHYHSWRSVTAASNRAPTDPTGAGLPSNMTNDVLVAKDGAIFVATDAGLAVSRNAGKSFTFYRGADYVAETQLRTGGPPVGWKPSATPAALLEDCVTALWQDGAGKLWIGYRNDGAQAVDAATLKPTGEQDAGDAQDAGEVRGFASSSTGAHLCILAYGAGLDYQPIAGAAPMAPAMPNDAAVLPKEYMAAAAELSGPLPAGGDSASVSAILLGEDWVARGDGSGRYGQEFWLMPQYGSPLVHGFAAYVRTGPHIANGGGGVYWYFAEEHVNSPRILYMPAAFDRMQGEWNDGTFQRELYPAAYEGPDLWASLTVPAGVHRVTLYFINNDGRQGDSRNRDFLVELKKWTDDVADADFAPALARTRVEHFYNGVYKQFAVRGPARYWVKISRDHGFATKLNAIFIDPEDVESEQYAHPPEKLRPLWEAPPMPDAGGDNAQLKAARAGWLSGSGDASTLPPDNREMVRRLLAYRFAQQSGADERWLAHWRWHLGIWTEADRLRFCQDMDVDYAAAIKQDPKATRPERVSMVSRYKQ